MATDRRSVWLCSIIMALRRFSGTQLGVHKPARPRAPNSSQFSERCEKYSYARVCFPPQSGCCPLADRDWIDERGELVQAEMEDVAEEWGGNRRRPGCQLLTCRTGGLGKSGGGPWPRPLHEPTCFWSRATPQTRSQTYPTSSLEPARQCWIKGRGSCTSLCPQFPSQGRGVWSQQHRPGSGALLLGTLLCAPMLPAPGWGPPVQAGCLSPSLLSVGRGARLKGESGAGTRCVGSARPCAPPSFQEPSPLPVAQPIHTRSGPGPLRGKPLCLHLRGEAAPLRCTGLGCSSLVPKSCLALLSPWTVAHQAPLSMGFSRREYRSRLPFPSPGDLPGPRTKPPSPALQAGFPALQTESLLTELQGKIARCRVNGLLKTDNQYWANEFAKSIDQVHLRNWAKGTNVDLSPGAQW